jgi:uncharacterized protein (UPF0332 family)
VREAEDAMAKARRLHKTAVLALEDADYDSVASRCYHAMLVTARALLATKGLYPQSERAAMVLLCERFIEPGDLDHGQGRAIRRAFELSRRADGGTELPVDREEATELLDRTMWFLDAIEGALGQAGG